MPLLALRIAALQSWNADDFTANTLIIDEDADPAAPTGELKSGPELRLTRDQFRSLQVGKNYRLHLVEVEGERCASAVGLHPATR